MVGGELTSITLHQHLKIGTHLLYKKIIKNIEIIVILLLTKTFNSDKVLKKRQKENVTIFLGGSGRKQFECGIL